MSGNLFQINEEFWRDRLEVGTALVVESHRRDDYMRRWIAFLTPRCRAVLQEHFGLAETEEFAHRNFQGPFFTWSR